MNADDGLVGRVTLVGWALLAVGWLALTVVDASIVPAKLAFGVALVVAGIGGTAAAGSPVLTGLATGVFFLVGATAFALSMVDPAVVPVEEDTLSLVGTVTVLAALVLVLAGRLDGDGTAT